MAERSWNMLKLVPSITTSRKNSMVTGLARIDENTEELILSLYHLPEPKDFIDVKDATYYAWNYSSEGNRWSLIGELQQKNGLTYSFKKRVTGLGDAVFVTAEPGGTPPMEPGEVLLSSDTELFYRDLTAEPEVEENPPVAERRPPEEEAIDVTPDTDERDHDADDDIEDVRADIYEETRVELSEDAYEEDEREGDCDDECDDHDYEHDDYFDDHHSHSDHHSHHDHDCDCDHDDDEDLKDLLEDIAPEEVQDKFFSLYHELAIDEVVAVVKDRYQAIKGEVDLRDYWDKCKEYCHDFYEDTKLKDLFEEIKDDLKDLMEKLHLDDLWCKIEDFLEDILEMLDPKKWAHKAKGWMDDIDIQEWYCKMKDYLDAVLDEVDLQKLWYNVKCWIQNLLEQMGVEEIMIWIKVKIERLRELDADEVRSELKDLFKQFADQIKMPELKMAVVKVAFKEKLNQVGGFFKRMKSKVDQKPEGQPVDRNQGAAAEELQKAEQQHQQHQQRHQAQPQDQYQQYQRPAQAQQPQRPGRGATPAQPQMNPYHRPAQQAPGMGQRQQPKPEFNMYNDVDEEMYGRYNPYIFQVTPEHGQPAGQRVQSHNPYARSAQHQQQQPQQQQYQQHQEQMSQYQQHPYYQQNPYYQQGYYQQSPSYQNPYYQMQQQMNQPPMMNPYAGQCQDQECPYHEQCQNYFQLGYDAMGDPRYIYDEEDENYFFITPDGEIIRKS